MKNNCREISGNIPIPIPDDVLFDEVLVRLPVKSLTVYKSVCKTWMYTIESNSFREIYRRRHIRYCSDEILFSPFIRSADFITNSSSLLPSTHDCFVSGPTPINGIKITSTPLNVMLPLEMTRIEWPDVVLDEEHPWVVSVKVLGPVKTTGIYCVVPHIQFGFCPGYANILICNLATRDYKLVNPFPPEEIARVEHDTSRCCVASYGFGLAADGDYKVVVVINWGQRSSSFLSYVYSLKQGSWKKIVDTRTAMISRLHLGGKPYYPEIIDFRRTLCPQVFVSGCWHWTVKFKDDTCNLLSFNVDNEVFKLLQGPPSDKGCVITDRERVNGVLTVLNDHLAVVHYFFSITNVWMMMEYGDEKSWINVWKVKSLYHISIRALVGISYLPREDSNGGIHIHSIMYQDFYRNLASLDEFGRVKLHPGFDPSYCIFWNNFGISAYSETLERL